MATTTKTIIVFTYVSHEYKLLSCRPTRRKHRRLNGQFRDQHVWNCLADTHHERARTGKHTGLYLANTDHERAGKHTGLLANTDHERAEEHILPNLANPDHERARTAQRRSFHPQHMRTQAKLHQNSSHTERSVQ